MKYTESQNSFPFLGYGVGLRNEHYDDILENLPERNRRIDWFEAISENYMGIKSGTGGNPISVLETVRANHPLVLHGVSLSIGSVDPLNQHYLSRLKELSDRFQPTWMSDHLCWTGVDGENLHDLLPLPYTEEALDHISGRVLQVQDYLKRPIALENVSSYLTFSHSTMTEWEFLSEICRRTECKILLDINNIYVSSVNHGFSAEDFLNGVPKDRVVQFHLAGHERNKSHLIDTHDHPVCEEVWQLYEKALQLMGPISTLLERDDNIPPLNELLEELDQARSIGEGIFNDKGQPRTYPKRDAAVAPLDLH